MEDKTTIFDEKDFEKIIGGILQLPAPKYKYSMPKKGDMERKFVIRMDESGVPKMIEIKD